MANKTKDWKKEALIVTSEHDGSCYQVSSKKELLRIESWGHSWSNPGEVLVTDTGDGYYFPEADFDLDYGLAAALYYLIDYIQNSQEHINLISKTNSTYRKDRDDD